MELKQDPENFPFSFMIQKALEPLRADGGCYAVEHDGQQRYFLRADGPDWRTETAHVPVITRTHVLDFITEATSAANASEHPVKQVVRST